MDRITAKLFPDLAQAELDRRFKLFKLLYRWTLVGLTLFTVLGIVDAWGDAANIVTIIVASGLAFPMIVAGFVIAGRDRFYAGVTLTLFAVYGLMAFYVTMYGTRDPLGFVMFLPILAAATVMQRSFVLVYALLAAATFMTITFMELHQVLPIPFGPPQAVLPIEWNNTDLAHVYAQTVADSTTVCFVYFIGAGLALLAPGSLAKLVARLHSTVDTLQMLMSGQTSSSKRINDEAEMIAATISQQEQGTLTQSRSIDGVAGDLHELLDTSGEIARRSVVVADHARETAENQSRIAERMQLLASHTERIGQLLETMKTIANKTELLALNAALEGVQAGESGQGFALVASRMQQMAEDVAQSVADVRKLMADISEASSTVEASTEQGKELAEKTAALTREISDFAERQRQGTERATQAMEEISHVARQTAAGTTQVAQATRSLSELSETMRKSATETSTTSIRRPLDE